MTPSPADETAPLAWLAWQLRQHDIIIFQIDALSPIWLARRWRWLPTWGLALVLGVAVAAAVTLGAAFAARLTVPFSQLSRLAPLLGLAAGAAATLGIGLTPWDADVASAAHAPEVARVALVRAGLAALLGAAIGGLVLSLDLELERGRLAVLVLAPPRWALTRDAALLAAVFSLLALAGSALRVAARARWRAWRALAAGLTDALLVGACVGAALAWEPRLIEGPRGGMVGGVIGWLVLALGGSVGVATPLVLAVALAGGAVAGLAAALREGGLTAMRRALLRHMLAASPARLPRSDADLAALLDAAVAQGIMQRSGAGWAFASDALRDTLAEAYASRRRMT